MELQKNLVYIYFLLHPAQKPKQIYMKWYKDLVLADYIRPELILLDAWMNEFNKEIYGNKIS